MRISDWSSDVCSSDLPGSDAVLPSDAVCPPFRIADDGAGRHFGCQPFRECRLPLPTLGRRGDGFFDFVIQCAKLGAGCPVVVEAALVPVSVFVKLGADALQQLDRKSVMLGKSVSVRLDLGGRRNLTKRTTKYTTKHMN